MEGGGTPFSSSMAPSGSYILIIVSQPVNDEHKKVILQRLNKGLLSWDVESTGCDLSGLETVCSSINAKHLDDTDVLIQHSTESLGVEVLVSPTVSTLKQCVKNLFSTSTGHKHLIHAGYTFAGTGSWILQNGTFSFDEFLDIFQQADVQSQKRCNIHVHCAELGSWNSESFTKDIFAKVANVSFNPQEKVGVVPGSEHLTGCLERVLSSQSLEEIMEASTLVGNIRFNRPTLYMFPAGQGDCALFGINGFNMLIDGGFNRKPCSWEFIRHLDRLDAVLVTRLCENNVCGMSTLMQRKSLNNTYPQIGYVFCNIAETKASSPKEETKNKDDLVVSVVQEGHNFTQTLNELKLQPHQCWRDSSVEPFVLYHKVGHGTLEMHVLSPPKDSKEMKEFLSEWSSYKETFSCIKSGLKSKSAIPLSHATSICAVLIWRPADPKDTITRILFPGSAPQNKIFESLERLKSLDVLKQPVVTKASLSVVATKTLNKVEKRVSRAAIPNRKNTASPALSVSSVASRNGETGVVKKEVKKVVKEVKKDNKDVVKKEIKKETKKDVAVKDVKKTAPPLKKEAVVKKEILAKEPKKDNKDIKQVVKKETKDLKATAEKKPEVKNVTKKLESPSAAGKSTEVKKTTNTTVRKSTTVAKKEVTKTTTSPKSTEVKKTSTTKVSEPKAAKEVSNKKAAEAKAITKTKPKPATSTPKSTPKTTPKAATGSPKVGNKVTKAVAASSIVASVVAVTAAAFELNEKKEEIVDTEGEIIPGTEQEVAGEVKDIAMADKSEEMNVSPLPPEVLSPTPSESISLTPSDTLSSAPLETVSPTPPLANEPISVEEKEVNEIKEIEQDPIPYEIEAPEDLQDEAVDDQDEIAKMIAHHQEHADVMSSSFMASKEPEDTEIEVISKTEASANLFSSGDVIHSKNVDETAEDVIVNESGAVKEMEYESYSKDAGNIDDQLAQMTMEGSYCVPATASELENDVVEEKCSKELFVERESVGEKTYQTDQQITDMSRSFIEPNDEDEPEENIGEQYRHIGQQVGIVPAGSCQENKLTSSDLDNECEADIQEKEDANEKYQNDNRFSPEPLEEHDGFPDYVQRADTHSIGFNNRAATDDYDISRNIIEDTEMQETSVDEPEEIVRKESAVSITLNDDNFDAEYDDKRRKSCTESEDDVDIQNYMVNDRKDSFDQGRLNPRAEADSDNEDVVKSPTPHAVVDYEGLADEGSAAAQEQNTEKKDFGDEKDHDSAEDVQEDSDDGEMIRHPTPEMKYSEDEMRDPIGQHYITAPGLKAQMGGITEQPLYEEQEDVGSERSVSPVVEQPVFGNVVEADFAELVTVSGGTTPSEPHSPKAGFDTKKFMSEAAMMDALSEHDCSEGSAHSPLCYDGNTAFELPVSEESNQKVDEQDLGIGQHYDDEQYTHELVSKVSYGYHGEEGLHGLGGKDLKKAEQNIEDLHAEKEDYGIQMYEQVDKYKSDHEQENEDTHEYGQVSKNQYDLENESKNVQGYEQENNGIHGYKQESKEMHGYEQESKDMHGYEQESKDMHGYEQESKDMHGYEQESKDMHHYEQESKDMHGYEQESKEMHGYEQESKEMHGYEQESKDMHDSQVYGKDSNTLPTYGRMNEGFQDYEQLPTSSNISAHLDLQTGSEIEHDLGDFKQHGNLPKEEMSGGQQSFQDDKRGNYDAQSDDESCSQNDKSETRSEKSDGDEEKSDIHRDDKSDHQHDSKSDMMDDDHLESKSDMHDDDRSESHFEDKQDDYEGKDGGSYEVPEGTRSHSYGTEHFGMDQTDKYEVHDEKYDIQEMSQSSVLVGTEGMKFDISKIQNKSIEDNTFAPDDSRTDFVGDVPENRLTAPLDFEKTTENVMTEKESNVYSGLTTEYQVSGIETEENLNKYNIPSEFHDNVLDSEKFSSNIPVDNKFNEFSQSNLTSQETYKADVDSFNPPENFKSSYDQYENIHTKETLSEYAKDDAEFRASGYSGYEQEVSTVKSDSEKNPDELLFDENKFQELGGYTTGTKSVDEDVISPQNYENVSGIENKVLTEVSDAHQYETLSKFEENDHTSNMAYSESSSIKNIISGSSEQQIEYSESTYFVNKGYNLSSNEVPYSTSETSQFSEVEQGYHHGNGDMTYSQMSISMHGDGENGFHKENATPLDLDNSGEMSLRNISAETRDDEFNYSQETTLQKIQDQREDYGLTSSSTTQPGFGKQKQQTTWSHSVSEYTTQNETETITQIQTGYATQSEQETNYIISSRFHSDSPEDNIMRSDSSPDVPPYPLDESGQLADLTKVPNMNLAKVDAAPLSPNKARNANQDSPYDDSSEDDDDDDSSSAPVDSARYAFTNKAYAKEEEDIDGNHIYKTMPIENTGIEKGLDDNDQQKHQVEFSHEYQETKTEYDANNPQAVTTHQVGYSTAGYQEAGETNYDFRLEEWGKPMGLPTPPDGASKAAVAKKIEKKSLGKADTNGKSYSPSVSKMSSPLKKPKVTKESSSSPVYVDLAYVPHHGDPQYCDVEFFKKVRARYYVFSGINPSKEVLNALLEAKKGWKEDLEVTIIPTYETDTLGYWMAQNQDALAEYSIEVAPSASRCTVNLQDHETSCAAYRLEF